MHSKIRDINFTYPKLVVGSSLEALTYSFINNVPFIYVELERPHRFDCFDVDQDLSFFAMINKTKTIHGPSGEMKMGLDKETLWEKLYFYLTLAGLNPMADKASSISIRDQQAKVFTHKARMAAIDFEELIVFTDEGVTGLPFPTHEPENKYKVYDWFNVRSGLRHAIDWIEDASPFVSRILFYPTDRVSGNHDLKDAVTVSYLTREMIDSYEYSEVNARFKTLYMMKKAGIRGTRNGRDTKDKTKFKYYSVKIENSHREIIPLTKYIYESTDTIKFNNDNFNGIIENNTFVDSYVAKIF